MKNLTKAQLKDLFYYEDGNLYWKIDIKANRCSYVAGDIAGTKHSAGYIQISFNKKLYLAHRLIFLWHYGYLPRLLDHIDGDKCNNRIENLREVSYSQNRQNTKKTIRNTSGYKNVYKRGKKWQVSFTINGKDYYYGMFDDIQDAVIKANKIRQELHGKFARHE